MKVRVNGQSMILKSEITTIEELLNSLDLGIKTVVVEQNQTILRREQHAETWLSDGDTIEIVHFVGGG